jgi:hypothetical protein
MNRAWSSSYTRHLILEGLDASGRDLTGTVASSGGGTRTPDTRIMIPLL